MTPSSATKSSIGNGGADAVLTSAGVVIERMALRFGRALGQTPVQLRLSIVGIWGLATIFSCVTWIAVERHRHEMQTIGKDSAPSIIAAQSIKWNLVDMHANVMREFLGTPDQARDSGVFYRARRQKTNEGLLNAAQNITYGDAERTPISALLDGLAAYDTAIAQSRILHGLRDTDAIARVRDADLIMHHTLIPAADALDKANQNGMDHGFNDERSESAWSITWLLMACIILFGGLAAVQVLIQRRMHRLLSPGLVLAATITIAWCIILLSMLQAESRELVIAKKDCFDSISAMWRARADAFDAQSQLAMMLLDPGSDNSRRTSFDQTSARLLNLAGGLQLDSVQYAVEQQSEPLPNGFGGYIADELRNITFPGEREAAREMLRGYASYLSIAGNVVNASRGGDRARAVAACLDDGGSALAKFDGSLAHVIDINQREFDLAVARGFDDVGGLAFWLIFLPVLVGVAGHVAISRRAKEYDA